jgi:Na+-transporting methylmalonyl-CoA/oxaloacetate decarboxylase gamma subunit
MPPQDDKLNAFFNGMRNTMQGPADMTGVYVFLLIAVAFVLAMLAITNWKNPKKPPTAAAKKARVAANHKKLLKEIGKGSGVPAKQLKAIEPLTQTLGASSPVVALLCPSLLKRMADQTHDVESRDALAQVARRLVEQDGT